MKTRITQTLDRIRYNAFTAIDNFGLPILPCPPALEIEKIRDYLSNMFSEKSTMNFQYIDLIAATQNSALEHASALNFSSREFLE